MVKKSMGNLGVISAMKECIMEELLMNVDVVKILKNSPEVVLKDKSLMYDQIVPYKKRMDTVTESKTIIAFEIVPGRANTPAARGYVINIWVMVHEEQMRFDAKVANTLGLKDDRGTRLDVLADKIDYMMNGDARLGFGKLEFEGAPVFDASEYYHGRQLVYSVESWNRYGDTL